MGLQVLTAGPSAGKSSTLREISSRGYQTLPEAARLIIDQWISEGIPADEVRERNSFISAIAQKANHMELRNEDADLLFLDRSLADSIAYYQLGGKEPSQWMYDACEDRYENIFLLEQLEFKEDYARDETPEEARQAHEQIESAYRELGYDPIQVPVMPIDERCNFILNQLDINGPFPLKV